MKLQSVLPATSLFITRSVCLLRPCMLCVGVHLGVKKMFSKLHTRYFWRGMYTDVVHFVRKCDKCWEQATVPHMTHGGESEDSEAVEDPLPLSPGPSRPTSRVWSKVGDHISVSYS